MTLSTTTNRVSYAGDGATTVFAVPFLFLDNSHIQAVLRDTGDVETTWTENTEYTLTGAGNSSGGTLTVSTSPSDNTPASGESLVIRRVVPGTQETDYPAGGAFPASAHEQALDKLTMLIQQMDEETGRRLAFPVSDSSILSAELPNSAGRASKYLAFDASGEPIASSAPAGGVSVSTFMETVLDDTSAAAARDSLVALSKDETDNLTVGYTTDADAMSAASVDSTPQPDMTAEYLKTLSVDANFTLTRPSAINHGWCLIKATVDAIGGRTMAASNITIVDGAFDGTANTVNWILLVHLGTGENARVWIWQE